MSWRGIGLLEICVWCDEFRRADGYGLAFAGDFAVVCISKARENATFRGLELDERLAQKNTEARCGVLVIDLRSGDCVHWLRIDGVVQELYDVAVLPGVTRPMALGFKSDEIRRTITIGESATVG